MLLEQDGLRLVGPQETVGRAEACVTRYIPERRDLAREFIA
jgi:hypothetical protein